jgi:hypothetical protein
MLSTNDELIGSGDLVWNQYTSLWPTVGQYKIIYDYEVGHIQVRDSTVRSQLSLIKFKKFADRESKDEKTFTMGGKEEIFLN